MVDRQTSDNPVPAPVDAPKFRVKFHDGPAAGMTREYDREQPTIKVFTWTYESTGRRSGDFWLFVKRPESRIGRKIIRVLSTHRGMDVRLIEKREPERRIHRGRNQMCWCGSGKKYKRCHSAQVELRDDQAGTDGRPE